jgi:cellulose biosynthesis protein BcsQ
MLGRLTEFLIEEERQRENLGESFDRYSQLLRVLRDADIPDRYDTLIVDPPATADAKLYNGIVATRNLVIPLELSGKGQQSVAGLEDLVAGLEEQLEMNVGVLAVVPIGFKDTRDQRAVLEEIESLGYDVPVTIRERSSLFEGCWRQQCSAFHYVEEHRSRKREYEQETLEAIEALSDHLHAVTESEVKA